MFKINPLCLLMTQYAWFMQRNLCFRFIYAWFIYEQSFDFEWLGSNGIDRVRKNFWGQYNRHKHLVEMSCWRAEPATIELLKWYLAPIKTWALRRPINNLHSSRETWAGIHLRHIFWWYRSLGWIDLLHAKLDINSCPQ